MKTLLKILLLMSLTSCHPSGKEVAGKYCARHGKGVDCIEMRKDGTFKQYFKNDTIEKTNEGTWKFETDLNQEKLVLRNFLFTVEPDYANSGITGSIGSWSCYWTKDEIGGGDDFREYNYYRQSD